MIRHWPREPLEALVEPSSPITYGVVKPGDPGGVPFVRGGDIADGRVLIDQLRTITAKVSNQYERTLLRGGELLMSLVGQPGQVAVAPPELAGANIARQVGLIRLSQRVLPSYASYFLQSPDGTATLGARTGGSVQQVINLSELRKVPVPVPPVDEQYRIVATLDEALEAIAAAKANTEQNLENARALFASFMEAGLARQDNGWHEAPIVECFKVKSGAFLPAKAMALDGDVPVYGGNGVAGSHSEANLSGDQIVIGRVGAKCGNVRHVSGDIWLTDNAFHVSKYLKPFDPAFLARVLNAKDLRQTANQAAQPVISYTTIKDVLLRFPVDLREQRAIAAQADELEAQVAQAEAVYKRKLAALAELKQSLLHQAFTGAL